jgi:hypothetical protein
VFNPKKGERYATQKIPVGGVGFEFFCKPTARSRVIGPAVKKGNLKYEFYSMYVCMYVMLSYCKVDINQRNSVICHSAVGTVILPATGHIKKKKSRRREIGVQYCRRN